MTQPMSALIGHRGLPTLAPENTQASLRASAEHGIDWVEIDVTMAGDGSLVIMHDHTLKRFGSPNIQLKHLSRAQLKVVDAGSWFDPAFQGEALLFLDDLLAIVTELDLGLNLELKINPDIDDTLQAEALWTALKIHHRRFDRFVVSSFHHDSLKKLRHDSPKLAIGMLYKQLPKQITDDMALIAPVSIHCDHTPINSVDDLKTITANYPVYCFTVNESERFKQLIEWGVSGIFSDRAHASDLRAIIEKPSANTFN